jgi:hypothetical protein
MSSAIVVRQKTQRSLVFGTAELETGQGNPMLQFADSL